MGGIFRVTARKNGPVRRLQSDSGKVLRVRCIASIRGSRCRLGQWIWIGKRDSIALGLHKPAIYTEVIRAKSVREEIC